MKILICADVYYPSVGGVQTVLQQIAERLVKCGHSVKLATTKLENRDFDMLNGVAIKEFNIEGNINRGLKGEVNKYKTFIHTDDYDVLLIKAAQGWTFDALIDEFSKIKKRKVFIPCGFSGLYYPYYKEYYEKMPEALRQFDHLIFYASDYRDINFAKEHNIFNYSVIPNGASEIEFATKPDTSFRDRLSIEKDDFVFLTVGTFSGGKGHLELAKAYQIAQFDRPSVLILNGNQPTINPKIALSKLIKGYLRMGPRSMIKRLIRESMLSLGLKKIEKTPDWNDIAQDVNSKNDNKQIIITDLERKDLIQAFLNSDLFVFASNIEYSPLVLFEAAAAGLPFLTVPVGNSKEIVEWTKGGEICPAPVDENRRTTVDPRILAENMMNLVKDPEKLKSLGDNGKKNWADNYTWDRITLEYEKVLLGNIA